MERTRETFRLALISMPWSIFNRPSIQLGSLKAFLEMDAYIKVDTFHPYLHAAKTIGIDTYNYISQKTWAGEALYSPLVFPEQRNEAEQLFSKRCSDKEGRNLNFSTLSQSLDHALTEHLVSLDLAQYDLIGLTICFSQLLPSLAAAARIKELREDLPLVVGGSSCGAELGTSLLGNFPQLDYVIDGEGENPLLQLCHYLAGRSGNLPSQVKSRKPQTPATPCETVKDINELPIPDYRPYFQELKKLFPGMPFLPVLPLEFSRGCWWNKCVFCNLNIQWIGYRWKNSQRMLHEVSHLSQAHQCLDFAFTDNALPLKDSDRFFQVLAEKSSDLRFFAEIRTITDPEKIALYRRGGLTRVQVGIESLSATLLDKLKKGTSVIENIAAMKFCLENDMKLEGNLITEFPTSTEREAEDTMINLNYILPYHPLSSAAFFLGTGSPVERNPRQYGLKTITQHGDNRKIFPKKLLRNLELLTKDYRGDRTQQRKIWKPVKEKIREWQTYHRKRQGQKVPALSYRDGGSFLIIRQEKLSGETLLHRLQGRSRELYLYCSSIRTMEEIEQKFTTLPQKTMLNFFDDLSKKRLLFQEGNRVLALAISTSRNFQP